MKKGTKRLVSKNVSNVKSVTVRSLHRTEKTRIKIRPKAQNVQTKRNKIINGGAETD